QYFLDLLGATNLIPGPNSTELVIHSSYQRAGWRGLIVGGSLFILPAVLLVLGFAWLYVEYGTTTEGEWLLYGIKPVVIAVVAQAIWGLGRTAIKNVYLAAVGLAVLALYLLGLNEIVLLFGAALLVTLVRNGNRLRSGGTRALGLAPWGVLALAPFLAVSAEAKVPYSDSRMFLTFVKIGAVLYGSGYVLLAFLRNDFVDRLGWLTEDQLLDAVAVGQFTPGPVFTTATFVGYLGGGLSGALVATIGIFLPAFVFVGLSIPLLPRLRRSPWTAAALDGVNVAAIGLMAAVAWELGRSAIVDLVTIVLALAAALLLIRYRVNSAWLVLGGGLIGIAYKSLI
ncbi:MAG TPA: chromate efflux transporter, partial [Thermomicrobiales bacterium]|nr:chromate efflux transporter [Thermomicrobiales bacterium]